MMTENTQCIASALRNSILNLGIIPKVVYQDNGKAIKLTKEILKRKGYEELPCDLTFKRYAENFRNNNYAE